MGDGFSTRLCRRIVCGLFAYLNDSTINQGKSYIKQGGLSMFQDLFNNFLSNLEYDNVSYKVASENGNTVVFIKNKNSMVGKVTFEDVV